MSFTVCTTQRKFGSIIVSIQMINQMVHLNAGLREGETPRSRRMAISQCTLTFFIRIFPSNQEKKATVEDSIKSSAHYLAVKFTPNM